MTIVVVGGGPTGVELAGSMAELCKRVFAGDFRRIDTTHSRIVLVQSGDRILNNYPTELSESAKRQLESLGVEVILNAKVTDVAGRPRHAEQRRDDRHAERALGRGCAGGSTSPKPSAWNSIAADGCSWTKTFRFPGIRKRSRSATPRA